MGPKVFISSTFYDLKFIREEIDEFVKNYKFETILFENGDIGYIPGKPLDESCYHYISKSDMVILIVGGEYGSPATDEAEDKFIEYMSITRKEFRAAKDAEVPIYVFILSEVDTEYWVYKKNFTEIENKKLKVNFHATKNINVFRFISEIRGYNNVVVNTFKKTSEIKDYLSGMWAGFFLHYLELLKTNKKNKKIENSLNTLKNNLDDINYMIDEVGKKLLGKTDTNSYEKIKEKQFLNNLKNVIANSFSIIPIFKTDPERKKFIAEFVTRLIEMLKNKTFHLYLSDDYEDVEKFYAEFKFDNVIIDNIKEGVELELSNYLEYMQKQNIKEFIINELEKDKKFCPIIYKINEKCK